MVGGVQYDSIPTGEPMTASASLTSFSLGQVEAGRTHPMLPPEEGRIPSSRGVATGGEGAANAAASGLGKNDLTNLKLASNQQVRAGGGVISGVVLTPPANRFYCWRLKG